MFWCQSDTTIMAKVYVYVYVHILIYIDILMPKKTLCVRESGLPQMSAKTELGPLWKNSLSRGLGENTLPEQNFRHIL